MLKNFEYCQYTYRHRKALLYFIEKNKFLSDEEKSEMMKRARYHDLDKMTMYLFHSKDSSSDYHRHNNKHHLSEYYGGKNEISYYDRMEAIFDFECAALTKWDKPLNAFDTMKKWYSELEQELLPILHKLHMDSSYIAITEEAKEYIKQYEKVTEEMILDEVKMYLNEVEDNVYIALGTNLCSYGEYLRLKGGSFMDWKEINEKYPNYRDSMTKEQERAFVADCFNAYENEGFSSKFWSPFGDYSDRTGESFEVVGRCTEKEADLEALPMWNIKFTDGKIIGAYPEEIIPSEMKENGCKML